MTDKCESCGVDLTEHLGLKGTCAKVIALQESLKQQSDAKRGYFDEYNQERIKRQELEMQNQTLQLQLESYQMIEGLNKDIARGAVENVNVIRALSAELAEARRVIDLVANHSAFTDEQKGLVVYVRHAREFLEKWK